MKFKPAPYLLVFVMFFTLNTQIAGANPISSAGNITADTITTTIIYPLFEENGTLKTLLGGFKKDEKDGKLKKDMEWIPDMGKVTINDEYIEVRFVFSQKAIDFFNSKIKNTNERMPIGIEIDINPSGNNFLSPIGRVERGQDTPITADIIKDTTASDRFPGYGAIIREPQKLKANKIYSIKFYPKVGEKVVLADGGVIHLTLQASVDVKELGKIKGSASKSKNFSNFLETLKLLVGINNDYSWRYFLVKNNGFSTITLKQGNTICWYNTYSDDPGCKEKKDGEMFKIKEIEAVKKQEVGVNSVHPIQNTTTITSSTFTSKKYPDLIVTNVWISGADGSEKSSFKTNEVLKMKAQFKNNGDANPKEDMNIAFYLSKGEKKDQKGGWKKIGTDSIKKENLKTGETHSENESINISKEITEHGKYNIIACIDPIEEKDKSNNCSKEAMFEVISEPKPTPVVVITKPDLVITAIGISGGKSSVKKGKSFSPAMTIKNIGNADLSQAIRSAYYLKGPETGNVWRYLDDDGTDAKELTINKEVREEIKKGIKIDKKGSYYLKACADHTNTANESNEQNNCSESGAFSVN